MLKIGDITIHLINDANTLVDPGGAFGLVPRALWSRYLEPTADHLVPMTTTCLLVQTGSQAIIVDTGFGNKLSEKQRKNWNLNRSNGDLINGLQRLGIKPGDIDLVIDTHLHADHCTGNTRLNEDGQLVAAFPNAEYVVQRREFEDASHPNERTAGTYFADNWELLMQNEQMRLLDGDTELAPGVSGIVAPGHTPGHMAVQFHSHGQYAAFVCDLASYSIHFERLAWMTAYDVEPLVTLETKRKWQQWALETDAVLIFPHDPLRPCARLTEDENGRRRLIAVDEPYI
jgi:glyoxylase-like metal-dependent hydrolase (beta-lactamase superfamily II)